MNRSFLRTVIIVGVAAVLAFSLWFTINRYDRQSAVDVKPYPIVIDYPAKGTIFPPEFPAPTLLWSDSEPEAAFWRIEIAFSDGSAACLAQSAGERLRIGEIDQQCISPTNELPQLTPQQAAQHSWIPEESLWSTIKRHSINRPATFTITGYRSSKSKKIVSQGTVTIQTSSDSVGAPIFYRDVPLMPSANEKGVIKPLDMKALPLIAWRLRNVARNESRLVMRGLYTCANCHSFSADGSTLGMDLDGPGNEKGLYAIVKIQPHMSIRNEDVVAWSTFRGKLGSTLRVGFMSQISPDAQYVITTINDPGIDQTDFERRKNPIDLVQNYYVANFRDYRFLQVFYPTRGVLAWYNQKSGHLQYLPGADDTGFVHANAVWSPDGKYLVFVRARARDAYPAGRQQAKFANDTNETPIQFDLYRIPFNEGKGGLPEPIAGASNNGMSNSFPKISPDGRWIVFVKSRNGLLMRPDGQLYIVPAKGGTARRMKCNTPLMNSWHSFSPNGRWMIFSSKSRSPYTQMYLTHIDESGDDAPAILIDNATAANRAVNIPEFVNISPEAMESIEAPAAEYALHADLAVKAMKSGHYETAVREWSKALELSPQQPWVHNSLGVALMETGKTDEAAQHYRKALEINPKYSEAYNNLGELFAGKGDDKEAIVQFEKALQLDSTIIIAHANLGMVLARNGQTDKAIYHLNKAVEAQPDAAETQRNLGQALAQKGNTQEAVAHLEQAVRLSGGNDAFALFLLGHTYADQGRIEQAVATLRQALSISMQQNNPELSYAIGGFLDRLLQTK